MKLLVSLPLLAIVLSACHSEVRQARPPRIEDDFPEESGADIAAEPKEGPTPIILTAEDKKRICCQQCTAAMANDRTGDTPDKVPCVDFTADLEEDCLKYFREHAMTAAEAQSCAGEPATPALDGPDAETPAP